MELKKCKICKEERDISLMAKRGLTIRGIQKYKNICKVCDNIRCRERKRGTEKEKIRITKYRLRTRYGLTLEDYNYMKSLQEKKCLICKSEKKLVVDHCHISGKVRGLLCDKCNLGIGHFKDDIENLKRAIIYLENN